MSFNQNLQTSETIFVLLSQEQELKVSLCSALNLSNLAEGQTFYPSPPTLQIIGQTTSTNQIPYQITSVT